MIPDWQTNAVLISDVLQQRHPEIVRRLSKGLREQGVSLGIVPHMADIWIRDAAPIQVEDGKFIQFRYQPDYLRGYERLITGPEIFRRIECFQTAEPADIILDGGNIVGTRFTAVITDKIYRANPHWNRNDLRNELRRLLQVKHLIVIPKEPYDPIGHADGMVRFVNETTVVVNDYSTVDPKFGHRLNKSLEGWGLHLEMILYRPECRQFDGIESAVGNYINFLRVGNLILVPSYGMAGDDEARNRLRSLCPDSTVTSIPSLQLAREGGVLQCVTWNVRI